MKHILITGGSRGIGAAIVKAFCAKGDRVVFFYRNAHAQAQALAAETGAFAICADVSDAEGVRVGTEQAKALLDGRIDVLVNNAGICHSALLQDLTDRDWHKTLDTNLSSAFYLCRAVQGDMIRAGCGRIINIGSMWGKTGAAMEVAYSASKAGLRGFTMALAKELGPSHITVNCIEPGVIMTDMNAGYTEQDLAALVDQTPLCRLGTPQDVAAAVLFLASDAAAFITGQCLGVDGGFAI